MRIKIIASVLVGLLILALAGGWVWLTHDLPGLDELPQRLNAPSLRITDRNGVLLYEALPETGGRHGVLPIESIPLALQQATIATEDHDFYTNPGLDWRGILRAAWANLRGGGIVAGGSTLTQQVARNLLLDESERYEQSLRRKLREAILAWRITRQLEKDAILGLYLNQTYYGGMAYGVEAAAQTFFGKPAAELDLAECALLAGLPQAPSLYNPLSDPEAAAERQRQVLGRMEAEGYIDAAQRSLAEREQLIFASTPYPIEAPHFVWMVRDELSSLISSETMYQSGGLIVRTTLDLSWQKSAESAILRQLAALQRSEDSLGHNVHNAALVAIDPHSGEIKALVGSPDFFDASAAGAINMALAPRQPGSALKPLVYAAALDPSQPNPWTAATVLLDVRTSFVTRDGLAYIPENYDRQEHGPVLLRDALASSLNIPAVITLEHVGLERLFALSEDLGIHTFRDPAQYDLSLALGGGEIRLLELTAAYGALATGGLRVYPQAILEVRDFSGNVLYTPPSQTQTRVLDERLAWLVSDILSDDEARRIGFSAHSVLNLDRPAAVKTGTTSNFHDNWTIGYTPDLVVGVWAGNTDYRPMRNVDGLSGAAPIWHQFMRSVLKDSPPGQFVQPPGFEQVEVCSLSGGLPTPACPYRRLEWFIAGTQPQHEDTYYQQVWLDRRTGLLAGETTPGEDRQLQTVLDIPPQAQTWARSQGFLLLGDLQIQAARTETGSSPTQAGLQMVSPADRSVYRLSKGLDPAAQRIRLAAASQADFTRLSLWLDGAEIASFGDSPPYETWIELTPGEHEAWAEAALPDGSLLASPRITFMVEAQ
ncbi:MAG TPA: transglycosylase domain-containing protein [Anaerolineales bacterium]|nr:transglycosylase domain-containing protein [Anaerolineales bacterium]